jgi:hypothetical protein
MTNSQSLISGYSNYVRGEELAHVNVESAPGISPVSVFATASSPECAAFSIGASAGVVTSTSITIGAGC